MRTARLALALLLAFGSSQSAKLPGQNHQGAQSSANSGSGKPFWWQNNNAFGGGGGSRPTTHASGNANAHASASSGASSSSGAASGGGSYGGGSYGGGSQQSGNVQNAANLPQITVQQPQQGFNPNVFTPDQSPHCARGQDCVRWQLCKNGVITLTGKNIPRQQPVPQGMSAKTCGMLGNVCCAIPAQIIATQQQLGHTNQVQTSNFQQPQQSPSQNQQSFPSNNNQQNFPSNQNQQSFPRPSQQQFQNQASFPQTINNNNIQPEVPKGPPFPECSASLLCIHQSECNLYNGFIEPQIEQWPGQPFVQINMCTSDTLLEGVCCQEPHPEFDPWTVRPELDQQPSGSQQNNFQQQVVGQKPQGQHTQQFGANGQQSKPQGNQGHSGSANRPQTNFQQPNTNSFQQPNRPVIQQPSQAINFPQQNKPRPQQPSQQGYQQPSQNNNLQPSQSQFQQPANNFQHRPQTNIQQPSQNNFQQPNQNQFQQPAQTNSQQPTQNFQQPNQNNFQQQPNKPVNPSHNDNHMPNLNIVGLPNQQTSFQGAGPNEQFPSLAPHPTCSSGLFCVQRAKCNLYTGFIEEQVQTHPDQQFIAINLCTSPTLKEGVCCQQKRPPGSQDDGQYRGPGAINSGTQDDGQYRGPGAINSGQQQTFVQQGSNPQQGFSQQQAQPQHNNFVAGNPAPQQAFNQQPQQTVGNQHSINNQHSGVQPGQQTQQQGGFDWQNNDAFQPQPAGTFKASGTKPSISSTPTQQLQPKQPHQNYRNVQHYNAVTTCFETENCVLFYHCVNGFIDERAEKRALFAAEYNPQRACSNPSFIGIPSVCCKIRVGSNSNTLPPEGPNIDIIQGSISISQGNNSLVNGAVQNGTLGIGQHGTKRPQTETSQPGISKPDNTGSGGNQSGYPGVGNGYETSPQTENGTGSSPGSMPKPIAVSPATLPITVQPASGPGNVDQASQIGNSQTNTSEPGKQSSSTDNVTPVSVDLQPPNTDFDGNSSTLPGQIGGVTPTNQNGNNQPDNGLPGTQSVIPHPDMSKPDNPQPGMTKPDSPQSGSVQPGSPHPDMGKPGPTQPDMTQPGSPQPGSPPPGSPHPDMAKPVNPQPGITNTQPDNTQTAINVPHISTTDNPENDGQDQGTSAPSTAAQCGISNPSIAFDIDIRTRTTGGDSQFGEFPWQAIIFFSNFTFQCGASLVGDRWIVTAAHCVDGLQPEDIQIRLGEWQVNTNDEPLTYVDASVLSFTIHPEFKSESVHNDIAVIELSEVVSPQYHINTICLPELGQTVDGSNCIATGWGKEAFEGDYQFIMKKIELPVVGKDTCQALLRKTRLGKYFELDKSFMCAGGEENADACKGDGGGPLACKDPKTGSFVLTGITAWGIGCGQKDIPGVYTDVPLFSKWVQSVMDGTDKSDQLKGQFRSDTSFEQQQPSRGYGK